jgi:hypothetical protein
MQPTRRCCRVVVQTHSRYVDGGETGRPIPVRGFRIKQSLDDRVGSAVVTESLYCVALIHEHVSNVVTDDRLIMLPTRVTGVGGCQSLKDGE